MHYNIMFRTLHYKMIHITNEKFNLDCRQNVWPWMASEQDSTFFVALLATVLYALACKCGHVNWYKSTKQTSAWTLCVNLNLWQHRWFPCDSTAFLFKMVVVIFLIIYRAEIMQKQSINTRCKLTVHIFHSTGMHLSQWCPYVWWQEM